MQKAKTFACAILVPISYFSLLLLFKAFSLIIIACILALKGTENRSLSVLMEYALLLSNQHNNTIFLIITATALITILLIFANMRKRIIQEIIDNRMQLKNIYLLFFLGLCIGFLITYLVNMLQEPNFSEVSIDTVSNIFERILSSVGSLTIIVLAEEVIFRGVMVGELNKSFPKWVAIVISTIFFSIAHGNVLQIIYTFLLGILLSLTYLRFQNILAACLLHTGFNLAGIVLVEIGYIPMAIVYTIVIICIISVLILLSLIFFHKNLQKEDFQS